MCTTIGDGIMAFSGIIGPIGGDAANLFVRRDLAEQIGQDRRVADMACGDLDGPDLQRLRVDSEVDLAPDAPFAAAMLARVPVSFALHLDPCAVDQKVQRALRAAVGDVHRQGLLAPGQRAEAVILPVEGLPDEGHRPDQPSAAGSRRTRLAMVARTSGATWLDLPERHAEQHLHR